MLWLYELDCRLWPDLLKLQALFQNVPVAESKDNKTRVYVIFAYVQTLNVHDLKRGGSFVYIEHI